LPVGPAFDLPVTPRTSALSGDFFTDSGHSEELVDFCTCRIRQMTAAA
jgi:hypothetical protein